MEVTRLHSHELLVDGELFSHVAFLSASSTQSTNVDIELVTLSIHRELNMVSALRELIV